MARAFSIMALALFSTILLCGNVMAVPYVWKDSIYDSTPISVGNPYLYSHSLDGFNPLKDFITDAHLEIKITDYAGGFEIAKIWVLGMVPDIQYKFKFVDETYDLSFWGLAFLNLTGQLFVQISAICGEFTFDYSHLTAYGCESEPHAVSEPGAMMILGFGLFGLAGCARKRFKR